MSAVLRLARVPALQARPFSGPRPPLKKVLKSLAPGHTESSELPQKSSFLVKPGLSRVKVPER